MITLSLANHRSESFRAFFLGFYARRVKRLVPALIVFVILTSLALCFFNPDPALSLTIGQRALFGLSNITLFRGATDYFAASTELNPFTHTWSLGVEEQFYFLFPFLIWLSGFGRQARQGHKNLFLITLALSTASLASFIWLYPRNQPAAYFLMPPRLWELGAGCLIYLFLWERKRQANSKAVNLTPFLLTIALISTLFIPQESGLIATLLVVALTAALIFFLKKDSWGLAILTHNSVVFLGLMSYSLYLWHWGVISISRWTIGIHWWTIPFQILVIFSLSIASYRFVEKPFRKSAFIHSNLLVIVTSVASLAASYLLVSPHRLGSGESFYLGEKTNLEDEHKKFQIVVIKNSCNFFEKPESAYLSPGSCGQDKHQGRPTIFLLGDSHASQLAGPIRDMAIYKRLNHKVVWGNTCLFPASVVRNQITKCYQKQQILQTSLLQKIAPGDIVIIANSLIIHFNPAWGEQSYQDPYTLRPISITKAAQLFSRNFLSLSDALTAMGAKVVFYVDGVQFKGLDSFPAGGCRKEWFRPGLPSECFTSLSDHKKLVEKHFSWRTKWQNQKNKFVWNAYLYQIDCDGDRCPASGYRDSNHFLPGMAKHQLKQFSDDHQTLFN